MKLREIKVFLMFIEYKMNKIYGKFLSEQKIDALYYRIRNWGDQLNTELLDLLGVPHYKLDIDTKLSYQPEDSHNINPNYLIVGSILQHANRYSIIWGPGFISQSSSLGVLPKKICAVRGPKSRELLLKQGIQCPEIYGDPALLLPYLIKNTEEKQYDLGIILHNDHNSDAYKRSFISDTSVKFINLRDDFNVVLRQVLSCRNIVSSSLHGLIVADAYGIPSGRLILDNALHGGDFKFLDYYSSINYKPKRAVKMTKTITKRELIKSCEVKEMNINLLALIDSCPFDSEKIQKLKAEILKKQS